MEKQRKSTEQRLLVAFFSLCIEYRSNDITVALLCRKARISRSLFYDRFSTLDEYTSYLTSCIANNFLENYANNISFERFVVTSLENIKKYTTFFAFFLRQNSDKTIYFSQLHSYLMNELGAPFVNTLIDYKNNVISKSTLLVHGIFHIVNRWFDYSDSFSSREVAQLIIKMVNSQTDYIENYYKERGRKIYEDDWGWYEELVKKLKNDKQL